MTTADTIASTEPYFTCPSGYYARHRDTTDQGRADGIRDDYRWLRDPAGTYYPARHAAGATA
jgi:hypothetical protein